MRIKLFAKEKPGLREAISFLNTLTCNLELYIGQIGDQFPNEAFENDTDIIISYISPWIIPESMLVKAKQYAINFHPGPPEYPGIGCTNFAIYEGAKDFGVTCHIMKKKVDSGKIISVKRFPVYENDSVLSLTDRAYSFILIQFYEVISDVFKNHKLHYLDETWTRKPFTRKELNELCRISLEMTSEEITRRIKATSFPNMPGAFLEIEGYKFEYINKELL